MQNSQNTQTCSMQQANNKGVWEFWVLETLFFLSLPLFVSADVVGDSQRFFIDSSYDELTRNELDATLRVANSKVYFYVENSWWNSLPLPDQQATQQTLIALGQEFEQNIYPVLTSAFGQEWKPGIDNNEAITVLLHLMRQDAGGYTNYGDEYPKLQNPQSNEREMVYLNLRHLQALLAKSFLAHEFLHLISFNQKERSHSVQEEVWLNEARAEYAPTLMGYDLLTGDTNIRRRINDFLKDPQDSLTEWNGVPKDYGVVNMFSQYLADQYGMQLFADSLKSSKAGIGSISDALQKRQFTETFEDVFTNWLIALFLNDCSYGPRLCYHNPQLVNLHVIAQTNFLPSIGNSTLTINSTTKDWAGNWLKVVGGREILTVQFDGNRGGQFKILYLVEDAERRFSLKEMALNHEGKGSVVIPDFNLKNRSLVLIPISKAATANLDEPHAERPFSFTIATTERTQEGQAAILRELLLKIDSLKKEIARLQAQLAAMQTGVTCGTFGQDLSFGMRGDSQVTCLQEFLAKQGADIYPEAIVNGNFFSKTLAAVVRFQEKYAQEILVPVGLTKGTGYVGSLTREKMNQLLTSQRQ